MSNVWIKCKNISKEYQIKKKWNTIKEGTVVPVPELLNARDTLVYSVLFALIYTSRKNEYEMTCFFFYCQLHSLKYIITLRYFCVRT